MQKFSTILKKNLNSFGPESVPLDDDVCMNPSQKQEPELFHKPTCWALWAGGSWWAGEKGFWGKPEKKMKDGEQRAEDERDTWFYSFVENKISFTNLRSAQSCRASPEVQVNQVLLGQQNRTMSQWRNVLLRVEGRGFYSTCLPGSPAGPLRPGGPCLISPSWELHKHLHNY